MDRKVLERPLILTILCPVHNEERVIPLFFERIRPVMEKLSERHEVHLLFLDNASSDQTGVEIEKVKELWQTTYIITMSRNVGYHASLQCGLRNARGDLFVIIDVDCEDPPEMILDFTDKLEQGFDIVYGERVDRHESKAMKAARKFFYRLLQAVADEEIVLDMAEFSLFTKEVRDAIIEENTSFPFLRASIGRVGFRRVGIPFKRQKRIAGGTHYNLIGMSVFAIGGILSASTLFLRLPILLLPFWLLSLLGLGVGFVLTASPWLALAAFVLSAAYIGATAAFTALYVARTYKNGLQRPNAFIDHARSILQPGIQRQRSVAKNFTVKASADVLSEPPTGKQVDFNGSDALTAEPDTCPVCGVRTSRVIYAEAHDPITLDSFKVVACCGCGLAYTTPRPLKLDRYYPSRYRAYGPLVTCVLGTLYEMRVSRWIRSKPEGGTVLEVGCGSGLMLAAFKRRQWRVFGIERSEEMAERARSVPGVEMVTTSIENLPADARFDLIILFQVLEHIGEPVTLLSECAKRLKRGGNVIVNVPNFASWQSRFAGPKWLHLDVPRHLNHFTPESLAETLERAGLKLDQLRFASLEHDPYGWVESAISRISGRTNRLTRFLMGLDPFGPAVFFSFVLGAVLMAPALLLAGGSWLVRKGALMEAMAVSSPAK
jgi:SAM-dependent methyltransferase